MYLKNLTTKTVSLLIVFCLLFVFPVVSADTAYMLGDVNNDKIITAADALLALQGAVKKITLDSAQFKAADVDLSGEVLAIDALYILQRAVDKIDSLPGDSVEVDENSLSKLEWLENASGYISTTPSYIPEQGEIATLYQSNVGFSGTYAIETDCVLAYYYGKNHGGGVDNWLEGVAEMYKGDTQVGIMIPANRDNGEYFDLYPDRGLKDVQTRADGSYCQHSTMNGREIYYMAPTESYTQYKWEAIDSIINENVKVVAIEEPEYWNTAGYSEGFKEEWEKYYGTEWVDQNSSAQAKFDTQKLKAHLFEKELTFLSQKIKEKYPDTKVLVATHCTVDYSAHGISTGIALYSAIETVDGIIGQTWSDSVTRPVPYAGSNSRNPFAVAMYEYNSYADLMPEGKSLYLLQDPASDAGLSQEEYESNYKTTVVASMMQQDTDYFQNTIWPQRAYLPMGMDYKNIQQNVNKMYNSIAGLGSKVYSGTKGIYLGLSDSAGWNIGTDYTTTGSPLATIYGISVSFIYDGIPLDTLCIDTLTDVNQLSNVNLLILGYDYMKPLSQTANKVISQWVQQGGHLLYVGGYDSFMDIESEWWGQNDTTPLQDLINCMELDITVNKGVDRGGVPVWENSSIVATDTLNSTYSRNTYTFTGSGFDTFMTVGSKNVGVKAQVGEGKATFVGLPSAIYSSSYSMSKVIRELASMTLIGSDTPYDRNDFYAAVRGNYYAYYNNYTLLKTASDKTFIDLFSADLDIIKPGSTMPRNTPVLYYDISDKVGAETPALAFTNGVELDSITETAEMTQFTVASPSSSTFTSLFIGNGKYPQKVTAVTRSGATCSLTTMFDKESNSLLVKALSPDLLDPVTVTIEWGDEYVKLDSNYEYDSFFFLTNANTYKDDILLDEHNCPMNDGCYFCDLDTNVTWKIDLKKYKDASMSLDICCNYVVSVSFDNKETWKVVEDWSKIGEFTKTGENKKMLTVSSLSYPEALDADYMYVKVGSCYMDITENPTKGWGANVFSYTLNYLTPAE